MSLLIKDLRMIMDYLYQDERRHFLESGMPRQHIFRTLKRLRKHLEKK